MTMKTRKDNQKHKIKQCSSNIIFSREYQNFQFNSLTEPWWSPRQANIFGILKRYFNSLKNVYLLSSCFLTPDLNLLYKYTINIIKNIFYCVNSNYFFPNGNTDSLSQMTLPETSDIRERQNFQKRHITVKCSNLTK